MGRGQPGNFSQFTTALPRRKKAGSSCAQSPLSRSHTSRETYVAPWREKPSGLGQALAAVIPPLSLFRRKTWIPRLGHGSAKRIEHARINVLAGQPLEPCVHFPGILLGELRDGANTELLEIPKHGGSDGNKV